MKNLFGLGPSRRHEEFVIDTNDNDTNLLNSDFSINTAKEFFVKEFELGKHAAGNIARFMNSNSEFDTSKTLDYNIEILADFVKQKKVSLISGLSTPETKELFIDRLREFGFLE
jgi:hypothetical protein